MEEILTHRGRGQFAFRLFWEANGLALVSDYEGGKAPRGPQRRNSLIFMGLSAYQSAAAARAKNAEFDGKLGDHLAVVELDGDRGIWVGENFRPGPCDHMGSAGPAGKLHSRQ